MKYAIVESGGKQFKAVEGSSIVVDLLKSEAGQSVDLDVLLLVDGDKVTVGTPYIDDVKVKATNLGMLKGPKLVVFKYRPKKHYRKKTGHRQQYTRLQIETI